MEEEEEEEGKERRRSKGWWRDTFLRCNDALGGLGIPDRDACADRLRKKNLEQKPRQEKGGGGSRSWFAPLSLSLSIFLGKMRSGERRISNFKDDVKSCFFFLLRKKRSLIYYKLDVL